tara:strand:+ start:150 stop:413 length:264 start_codon:yes stop_codon:yes gene_type:complete
MKKFGKEMSDSPFARARRNVDQFGNNMYYTHLLQESLEQIEKAKLEYDTALSSSDEKLIASTKMQLQLLQTVFDAATAGFTLDGHSC